MRRALAQHFADAGARTFYLQLLSAFVAYFIAGKLGQATTNIRSSNLGPVWPAYGIALAAFLKYGYRVWPGIISSAFIVALEGSVPPLGAAGQAMAATAAAATGAEGSATRCEGTAEMRRRAGKAAVHALNSVRRMTC